MTPSRVSVLIVSHNAARSLERCLRSVVLHTRDVPFEILVMDNGSSDGSAALLKRFARGNPGARFVLLKKNLGKSAAINRAARLTSAPWLAILDDDVVVGPDWLARLLKAAEKAAPAPAIVGCRSVYPDGRIFAAELPVGMLNFRIGERDLGQRNYTRFCDIVAGNCMLVRADVFSRIRFDEDLGQQYEDVDFCLQARALGFKILYCGGVFVEHENAFRGGARSLPRNYSRTSAKWGIPCFRDSHPLDKAFAALCRAESRKDWRAALKACRRLKAIDPTPAYARWWEAITLEHLGDQSSARRELAAALRARCLSREFRLHVESQALAWRGRRGPRLNPSDSNDNMES